MCSGSERSRKSGRPELNLHPKSDSICFFKSKQREKPVELILSAQIADEIRPDVIDKKLKGRKVEVSLLDCIFGINYTCEKV